MRVVRRVACADPARSGMRATSVSDVLDRMHLISRRLLSAAQEAGAALATRECCARAHVCAWRGDDLGPLQSGRALVDLRERVALGGAWMYSELASKRQVISRDWDDRR